MARTYSNVPEPRYVERAKEAENSGGGIFIVTANETKFADITEAYNAGKLCVLRDSGADLYISTINDYYIEFIGDISKFGLYAMGVTNEDEWEDYEYEFLPADIGSEYAGQTLVVDEDGYITPSLYMRIEYVQYNHTTFVEVLDALQSGALCIVGGTNAIAVGDNEGPPPRIEFAGVNNTGDIVHFTLNANDEWTENIQTIKNPVYYCTPNQTSFTEIISLIGEGRIGVVFDGTTVYYVDTITMSGDTPILIRFRNLDPNSTATWEVDYNNTWTYNGPIS